MNYIPHPMDTRNVQIPEELLPLMEDLAKNVHEIWSEKRKKEGWTYGPVRDDVAKKHPGLVPYEQLSEVEKEYDRATSQESLKFILKSGFKITKNY